MFEEDGDIPFQGANRVISQFVYSHVFISDETYFSSSASQLIFA
jgi:hypothetical protein